MSKDREAPFQALSDLPISKDAADNLCRARGLIVTFPDGLHVDSKRLVQEFACELAQKLRDAEEKYGYSDGWLKQDWEDQCRDHMREHMAKGDPRDVAIYAAFMWARGWATV